MLFLLFLGHVILPLSDSCHSCFTHLKLSFVSAMVSAWVAGHYRNSPQNHISLSLPKVTAFVEKHSSWK
jgi:hypothetical protein